MDWFMLIVLVPAVVVPIVLIWGFAGCPAFSAAPDPGSSPGPATPVPPAAPTSLEATGVSTSQIKLSWQHASAGGVDFLVGRQRADGSWDDSHGKPDPATPTSFEDKSLDEGKFYSYRVIATLPGIPTSASGPSNVRKTRTLQWEAAYDKPLAIDGGNFPGDCLVQRFDKNLLTFTGKPSQIRITVRGSMTAALKLDRVYISQAVPPGGIPGNTTPDPWDSNTDLAKLYEVLATGVPQPLDVPANTPTTLGPINYILSKSNDFIIAFDINAANGAARRREADVLNSTCYANSNIAEATKTDRTSVATQWPERPNVGTHAVYFVQKIEVLTAE